LNTTPQSSSRPDDKPIALAEFRLLNALVKNPVFMEDNQIAPDLFYHSVARSLYQAIETMADRKVPFSEAALLQHANEIDFNVSKDIVAQVVGIDPQGATHLQDMLEILHKAKTKREVFESLQNAVIEAGKHGELNRTEVEKYLSDVEIHLAAQAVTSDVQDIGQWMADYIADLRGRTNGKRYPFGDVHLDKFAVKGAYPGAYTIIAADTGMGKTSYVVNLINGMLNQGIPCLYLSLEMSSVAIMDRLISIRKNLPTAALYDSSAMTSVIAEVEAERAALMALNTPFEFTDIPDMSMTKIRKIVRDFKKKWGVDYLIIFIDLLSQVEEFMEGGTQATLAARIDGAVNKFNSLLKKENAHGIGVVQFRRDVEKDVRVRGFDDLVHLKPMLHHIKNGGGFAERGRLVVSLFRAKHYGLKYIPEDEQVQAMDDIMEVSILKQNDGPSARFHYLFDGEVFTITPIVADNEEKPGANLVKAAENKLDY